MGSTDLLWAQAIVEGRLVDKVTKQSLQGAHIFLSGTKIGDQTDLAGHYRLQNIPPGFHSMVVSMIGYGLKSYNLQVGPKGKKFLDLSLESVVYEMNDLNVGHLDRKWEKNYDFEELFLGYTDEADSVVILNPEVLRFDSYFWERLTAEALAPLRIENRREAFYESIRHFWLSLLHDRLEEEGFLLYHVRESTYPSFTNNRRPVSFDRLTRPGEEYYLHEVQYSGSLEIIYAQEAVDRCYLEWARDPDRSSGHTQVSWLELNERFITVDAAGEIEQPYGATQLGYSGFHRLADMIHREYRPKDFLMQAHRNMIEEGTFNIE